MSLPAHPPHRLPAGLCVFGIPYLCGLTWAGTAHANPAPLAGADVLRLAAESGLSWVEMPPRMWGGTDGEALASIRRSAEELELRFIMPGGRVNAEALRADLQTAAALGAPAVRCTLSSILCGERGKMEGGWAAHLTACERELEAVLPEADRLKIAIAIENHQDADSEDLLRLCRRFESAYLGITLDTGNPLAVMEEPVEFARRLAPYLKHAHLKDYKIYPAENGYRLVRCPMGEGAVDFPALFRLFDSQEWPITRNLEQGALHARRIPMLERSWWDTFPSREVRDALPALSVVWRALRPAGEEWRTPLEREAGGEELAAYEWSEYRASLAYLRGLVAG